jgi:hypothetical protein
MNFIEKCRRTRRDRAAGLVFRWRVSRGSFWRTLTAVMLAVGVFAGAASIFQVKEIRVNRLPRETYRITMLTPGHEGSRAELEWVRRNSTFLDRWEPEVESGVQAQLAALEADLIERTKYQSLLLNAPKTTRAVPLPELFDLARPRLPKVGRERARVVEFPRVEVRVFAEAKGALKNRWMSDPPLLSELLSKGTPRKFLGFERRFRLCVDAAGAVIFCRPLDGEKSDLDADLGRWLRQQLWRPANPALGEEWGEILVAVRGKPLGREAP